MLGLVAADAGPPSSGMPRDRIVTNQAGEVERWKSTMGIRVVNGIVGRATAGDEGRLCRFAAVVLEMGAVSQLGVNRSQAFPMLSTRSTIVLGFSKKHIDHEALVEHKPERDPV